MIHTGTFSVCRSAESVYALLADPCQFAPLLPDYESMDLHDSMHFKLRTVIAVGQINGHANLEMEVSDCTPPNHVRYRGEGIVAGSTIRFGIEFRISPEGERTDVQWQGEVSVEGMLAFMAGELIESKGRADFDRMAERLRRQFEGEHDAEGPGSAPPSQSSGTGQQQ